MSNSSNNDQSPSTLTGMRNGELPLQTIGNHVNFKSNEEGNKINQARAGTVRTNANYTSVVKESFVKEKTPDRDDSTMQRSNPASTEATNTVNYALIVRGDYASKGSMKLEYYEPSFSMDKGKFVGKYPQEMIEEGISQWKETITGYFVGTGIPFHMVKDRIRWLRGVKGSIKMFVQNSVYNFTVEDLKERDKVLERGPWHIVGKYFMVQKWDPYNEVDVSKIKSIPIWVKFLNLPEHCWTVKALSQYNRKARLP
ncbi:hypothetical protein GIB67_032104 [Kingdonia uniflora]|uniref:DUF4283 domain-containing protein n=1 Tax=Kingdonia uniflora TaxID=39325 RepID=A0A7J7MWT0_9MAGN|nr:hypothetical protein GIB67_032104 [Kingdonia uniflora]